MSKSKSEAPELARVVDQALEVRIAAAPAAVWQALTADIARWWPAAFYCGSGSGGSAQSKPRFQLEAHPGGRMWEDWGGGDGLLWAHVVGVVRGKRLDLVGSAGPQWGGPSTSFSTFEITADGAGSKLRFVEATFGRTDDANLGEKEKGWRFLLAALAAHVEGRAAPVWGD